MKTTARLLLAGAIAAASFGLASPASACEGGKCGPCKVQLDLSRPISCTS